LGHRDYNPFLNAFCCALGFNRTCSPTAQYILHPLWRLKERLNLRDHQLFEFVSGEPRRTLGESSGLLNHRLRDVIRVTFFAEWLLYISSLIRQGRYVVPFDAESRFAPMPASDIARVVVGILENPAKHAGKAYQLHGPAEYSHGQIAALISRVLNKEVKFEQVSVSEFLALLGLEKDQAKRSHFESVRIDQQEGLLEGTDEIGKEIIGQPLMTLEEFVSEHREALT
jgi:hypothetical protein